jgi:DNA repair protein RadC
MRRKLADHGARVFDTYELLEMLLYYTVPIKDTNPIAKRLLAKFRDIDGVLSADAASLSEVDGIGQRSAELIVAAGALLSAMRQKTDEKLGSFENYDELGSFLARSIGKDEFSVTVLSFDNKMRLIGKDMLYALDFASGGVKPHAFVDALLRRGASVAVVAHNHPHGPICPTAGDRETNIAVEEALSAVGIIFVEHYIICGDKYFGFMHRRIEEAFAQTPELRRFYESRRRSIDEKE